MTPELKDFLARVKGYTERATKGPWIIEEDRRYYSLVADIGLGMCDAESIFIDAPRRDNVEFISNSRTDLPKALEIIEQQAKEIEELKAKLKQDNDGWLKIVRDKDDEMEVMKQDLIVLASKMGLDLA